MNHFPQHLRRRPRKRQTRLRAFPFAGHSCPTPSPLLTWCAETVTRRGRATGPRSPTEAAVRGGRTVESAAPPAQGPSGRQSRGLC